MNPAGKVYTCHILDEPIGMLAEGYDRLVRMHPETVAKVETCPVNCWMTCTVAPMMRRKPLGVGWWIARRKIGRP